MVMSCCLLAGTDVKGLPTSGGTSALIGVADGCMHQSMQLPAGHHDDMCCSVDSKWTANKRFLALYLENDMQYVPAGKMPPSSAPLIDRWFDANGIVMGKTALHELQAGGTRSGSQPMS